jgi:hypothetical protein
VSFWRRCIGRKSHSASLCFIAVLWIVWLGTAADAAMTNRVFFTGGCGFQNSERVLSQIRRLSSNYSLRELGDHMWRLPFHNRILLHHLAHPCVPHSSPQINQSLTDHTQ